MMNRLHAHGPALVLGVVALLVLSAGPLALTAGAQDAVPTVTSASVAPGGSDTVSGGGCVARTSVQVQFDGALLVTTKSSSTGTYKTRVIVPVKATPGTHKITVLCAGPAGQLTSSTDVSVDLARTGSRSQRDAVIAAGLIAVGGVLLLMRRLAMARPTAG